VTRILCLILLLGPGLLALPSCGAALTGADDPARAAEERGDLEDAARLYEARFDRAGARDFESARALGLLALKRGDAQAAVRWFTAADDLLDDDPVVLRGLARASRLTGELERATACLQSVLERNPQDADARLELAEVALAQRRHREAVALAQEATGGRLSDPAEGWLVLGRAQEALGVVDQAEAAWRKAVSLQPESVEALYRLGRLYNRLGMASEAAPALEKAVALSPGSPEALKELGAARLRLGQAEAAVVALQQARQIAPDDVAVLNNLGVALRQAGRESEAAPLFEEAVRASQGSRVVYANLADAWLQLGEFERAQAALQEALRLGLASDADRSALRTVLILRAYRDTVCSTGGGFDRAAFSERVDALQAAVGLPPDPDRSGTVGAILRDLGLKSLLDQANQRCKELMNNAK
jgi:tetratricopeptide (TPR) repeat protein